MNENFEIELIGTDLKNSLNADFYENSNPKIAKEIILNSLSTHNFSFVIEENFLQNYSQLNIHLRDVNHSLINSDNSYYIGLVETLDDWKKKKKILKRPFIGIIVRIIYFVFLRILPKFKWYQLITLNKSKRLLSK